MNDYELILFMWVTILTLIFIHFVIDMQYRTKKLKDDVDDLHYYINVALYPQIKTIRKLVTDEIINKKEDNTNTCSMEKCPIDAFTFKSCDLSENECEYYTSNDAQEEFQDDWEGIRHWLTRCKRDGAKDYYINKMWDIVQSRTNIINKEVDS